MTKTDIILKNQTALYNPTTEVGSRKKEIYKLEKSTDTLIAINTVDFQDYIDSFAEEANYKATIAKLKGKEVELSDFYPEKQGAFYEDVSEVSTDIIENIDRANEAFNIYEYNARQKEAAELQKIEKEKEDKKDEN